MPYGTFKSPNVVTSVTISGTVNSNGSGIISVVDSRSVDASGRITRSGGNTTQKIPVVSKAPYKKVPRIVSLRMHSGPKLAYKKVLPNGKIIWVRQKMTVHRLQDKKQRQNSNRKKFRHGLDLKPNALSFVKSSYTKFGGFGFNISKDVSPSLAYISLSGDIGYANYQVNQWGNPSVAVDKGIHMLATGLHSTYTTEITQARNVVIPQILDKIKDQKVNLAQAFAERRQTARLIGDTVSMIAKAVHALKKGNVAKAVREILPSTPSGVANARLAYAYGVKPLLQDVHGAAESLSKTFYSSSKNYIDIIAAFTVYSKGYTTVDETVGNTFFGRITTKHVVTKAKITVKRKYRFLVTYSGLKSLSEAGITNPASLAWELIPYSFVADWFIPIGDYLSRQDALMGVTFDSGHETVVIEEELDYSRTFAGMGSGTNWVSQKQQYLGKGKVIQVTRTLLTSPPDIPRPEFKDPVSTGHLLNATALITQLFNKRK